MHILIKSFIAIALLIATTTIHAQSTTVKKVKGIQTEKITVRGVCDMCKDRIEKAALVKGVKMATWDANTQELTVMYKAGKVTPERIQKAVAATGHDTQDIEATEEAYKTLPDCCAYRDGVEVH